MNSLSVDWKKYTLERIMVGDNIIVLMQNDSVYHLILY